VSARSFGSRISMRRINEAAMGERFGGSGGGDFEEAM